MTIESKIAGDKFHQTPEQVTARRESQLVPYLTQLYRDCHWGQNIGHRSCLRRVPRNATRFSDAQKRV